jgi:hypothetical protein
MTRVEITTQDRHVLPHHEEAPLRREPFQSRPDETNVLVVVLHVKRMLRHFASHMHLSTALHALM